MHRVLTAHRDIARVAIGEIPTGHNALDRRWRASSAIMLAGGAAQQVAAYAADVLPLYVVATAYEDSVRANAMGLRTEEEALAYFEGIHEYFAVAARRPLPGPDRHAPLPHRDRGRPLRVRPRPDDRRARRDGDAAKQRRKPLTLRGFRGGERAELAVDGAVVRAVAGVAHRGAGVVSRSVMAMHLGGAVASVPDGVVSAVAGLGGGGHRERGGGGDRQ